MLYCLMQTLLEFSFSHKWFIPFQNLCFRPTCAIGVAKKEPGSTSLLYANTHTVKATQQ